MSVELMLEVYEAAMEAFFRGEAWLGTQEARFYVCDIDMGPAI